MTKTAVQLDDKYVQDDGRLYLTSMQALVRLPMVQRRRDVAAGLNTAGYISGYRGSPIGTYDAALWAAGKLLKSHHIEFLPGVNEELAATSIRGAQQMEWFAGPKYDGVFGLWYGKGLGVDRATEALKMANFEGAAKNGGVLVVVGDDHGAKSSATAHQSEQALESAMIPILYPSNTQEILDFGLYGWAMSRYCGAWIALKGTNDTLEVTASVYAEGERVNIVLPGEQDFAMPAGGLNLRRNDFPPPQEDRAVNLRPAAAQAFARVNGLDRVVIDGPRRELGIVTCGKPYLDVRQALSDLGIDEARAAALGIRLLKLALTWPVEPQAVTAFAKGHRQLFVIEEKRAFVETQISRMLYNMAERPALVGKRDEDGRVLLPAAGDLNAAIIREAIFARLQALGLADAALEERMARIKAGYEKGMAAVGSNVIRTAYFCSGCPHNTSTKTPEGSVAFQGVGCHALAAYFMPDRPHAWTGQMGSEGAMWLGLAPFVDGVDHVFQNLGDGTYFHSGILAIRAAVAAKRNITYKLLYNDAIAMTGGQPLEGELSVLQLAQQLYWEGVKPVMVVTDEPEKYPSVAWPEGTRIHHRDDLDKVQRELREVKGVSALIYDQTCASEKRRRRKRGTFPDPQKRVLINPDVCEGCGDCSVQSNCVSVQPLETELGRKRTIDQSTCNKDYSCLKGFCPSFVTVEGGALRKAEKRSGSADAMSQALARIPEPSAAAMGETYDVLVTGIGGTGVLTVTAVLGMAAHIEGMGATIMDMTGMAQKGGAVLSHLRIGARPDAIFAPRLGPGMAHLLLGCDLVVTTGKDTLQTVRTGETRALVNSHVTPTAQFQANAKIDFGSSRMTRSIEDVVGADRAHFVEATSLATRLLGDSIATNMFMVGYASQLGLLPLSLAAIEQAIRLNGVAVETNLRTFGWGRVAAAEPATAEATAAAAGAVAAETFSQSLDEQIERRAALLTSYQNAAWAKAYREEVALARAAEAKVSAETAFTGAVARNLAKLMAYKDEYEVARLHASSAQAARVAAQFDGEFKLKFHLSPPLIARKDPTTGLPRKMEFGSWMLSAFNLLQKGKSLRGTAFDVFGYTHERKTERRLIGDYKAMVQTLAARLTSANLPVAVQLAELPDEVRGFGHVKAANLAKAEAKRAALMEQFLTPAEPRPTLIAAE